MSWYYTLGSGKIKAHKLTLIERYRMWKKRRQRSKEVHWLEYQKWLL